MTDLDHQPDSDLVVALPATGSPDLVCLPRAVRDFLAGLDGHRVAEAMLVATVLVGDAFRYGRPPVSLRLERTVGTCLRIEVEDHRPLSPNARPFGYRARLLDGLGCRQGLGLSDAGGTRAWAEMSLLPGRLVMRPGHETPRRPARQPAETDDIT